MKKHPGDLLFTCQQHVLTNHAPRVSLLLAGFLLMGTCSSLFAQEEEDEDFYRPPAGLSAVYEDAVGKRIERSDEQLAFHWPGNSSPDLRLSPGAFTAKWNADLDVRTTGKYRFHFYAAGKVSLKIADQQVLQGDSAEPRWFDAEEMKLEFGLHPLEVTFERLGEKAEISLYWSGPDFGLEPLTSRWLSHEVKNQQSEQFERGQELARALRCAACHQLPEIKSLLPAPALDQLSGNVNQEWLLSHLTMPTPLPSSQTDGAKSETNPLFTRRMPRFQIQPAEAEALAAYLLSASLPVKQLAEPAKAEPPKQSKENKLEEAKADPAETSEQRGRKLVFSLGCLACHQVDGVGTTGPFSGGELAAIAKKRPADFFIRWLREPQSINRDHRMPIFALSQEELTDLAAYLTTLKASAEEKSEKNASASDKKTNPEEAVLAKGRQLLAQFQCAACHRLPAEATPETPALRAVWTKQTDWSKSCVSQNDIKAAQPSYDLSDADKRAVEFYFQSLPVSALQQAKDGEHVIDAAWLLREKNCTACHQRNGEEGLAEIATKVVTDHLPGLAPVAPALVPPSLSSVGDKLHDKALLQAISAEKPRRPWLLVRMPRFQLTEQQQAAILDHLKAEDRIPDQEAIEAASNEVNDSPEIRIAGGRLVTADGFGCTSCHQVGGVKPVKVELNAIGPELSQLSGRIRKPWFDRWVRNPTRIVPRMEMPAIRHPVPGVLDHELETQLAAVWDVLNLPDFTPPQPNPIRVLRRHNVASYGEPTTWLIDNLEHEKKSFVKPLLLALPNRHNVLIDLQQQRLAGWWIGDAALQRTRGKYWYWETTGTQVVTPGSGEPELMLVSGEKLLTAQIDADFPPAPDQLRHLLGEELSSGVQFSVRMNFPADESSEEVRQVMVKQQILPVGFTQVNNARAVTGFSRLMDISGLEPKSELLIRVLPAETPVKIDPRRKLAQVQGTLTGKVILKTPGAQFESEEQAVIRLQASEAGTARISIAYYTDTAPDQFFMQPNFDEPGVVQTLNVAPGWKVERLALPAEFMPISLAWREDNRLLVGSLKNRVWQATDRDGDGLEDRLRQIGDEFVQPYGLTARVLDSGQEVIDVLDKTAMYRLHDDDGDEYFERTETLVDGWGHSTDYHGWMVGMPRDETDSYYAALSQRKGPAAHLRGEVLKLFPREPTADNPRSYGLETVAWGLRFPVGIARNSAGVLFVTDNQGQYNAWNELNRILPGRHYGFIDSNDSQARKEQEKTGPNIAIPHPWVRSVNGICFLETPARMLQNTGEKLFGKWEGHLIGCEYDTRRLIRMSLHQVGDHYEGAAYPFTLTPQPEQDTSELLLGPLTCQVSPQGDLYVGGIRDSAYGGGNNSGELVRFRFSGELPPGIAEVRRTEEGLEVDFATSLDSDRISQVQNYELVSYHRVSTPAYGGPDQDRRSEKISEVKVREDGSGVTLLLPQIRLGHVYELHVKNLVADGELFHPAEAYYSAGPIP